MPKFENKTLADQPDVLAPDGSEVRILCQVASGSMAHFTLRSGQVSKAVAHQTVEELWYFVSGRGRIWRCEGDRYDGGQEEILAVSPGTSISIPTGTRFQFRCDSQEPLVAVGVTMPPWPGEDEAVFVPGAWDASS